VSFTFRCALIFVDTYAHTLFLEVNSIFHMTLSRPIIGDIFTAMPVWCTPG